MLILPQAAADYCDLRQRHLAATVSADSGLRSVHFASMFLQACQLQSACSDLQCCQQQSSRHAHPAELGVWLTEESWLANAAPRVGDAAFAAACESAYPQRIYHFVHASDIVPRVPPQFLEYQHTGRERFITTFGKVLSDDAEIKRWHRIEGLGFLPLYLYKICAGVVVRGEILRTLYRIVLLVVLPGLADHWPSDYEDAMRRHIDVQK